MAESLSARQAEFVQSNQGKHFCQCGCGQAVPVKPCHAWKGVPRFVHGHNRHASLECRFWRYVVKTDTCWLWTGAKHFGYGVLRDRRNKRHFVHRLSWEIANGRPVPEGMDILHTCPGGDNRNCVNPDHLRTGTQADNNRDTVERGRQARGERVAGAKLTTEKVRAIRDRHAAGIPCSHLAAEYGVGATTIGSIVRRRKWKHVT